ncbi:MAG: response regulator transcription factor [Candidatus Eisenbacteria bacterium]|uniref:Response regulator transcription factor n=1 Tax=Eiseniibacteriota bacterium TaxID=2212470 RepID=A0A538SLS9_UNCEI|nr:MAG: response regulator transcription factor [Candidatus Eisenbacteria bacterium]
MSEAPLRIVVVDDEPLARERLRRMLGQMSGVELLGEAGSAPEARALIARASPNVVLLDVQMPGEDGFALLRSLEPQPAVIFVTAFDHYAVRAFEERALDYLMKPFRRERLAGALERARAQRRDPAALARRLDELLRALERGGGPPAHHLERLTVRVGNRIDILKCAEVLWFGAEEKLVFAATADGRHYVNFTLDQLDRRLDPARFLRVHRSAIANLDFAESLRPAFAGTYRLVIKDAARSEIPVSRQRARLLRERLGA